MFSKQELKELAEYQSKTAPVLSVYLNVDSTQLTVDQSRLALKGMLKSAADKASRQDIKAVEKYFDLEYDRRSKGIVILSCAAQDFWRVYPLAVPVDDHVYVSSQPYIKPLADILDIYDRYGVVLVNREGARLYLFYLGALQDVTGTYGQELRAGRQDAAGRGGRSGRGSSQGDWTASLEHRIDQLAERNLREVGELTQRFYKAGQCERIILAGTDENRARFMGLLSRDLQDKVVGSFAIDMGASVLDVLERSLEVIQTSEAERKAGLVQAVITAAHKGNGSLGLANTLNAVQEQRVQTLVISQGFRAPGSVCTHCAYLTLRKVNECPVCGGSAQIRDDIVDDLLHRALVNDVEVVFVQDEALEEAGSIGALWRF